MANGLICGIYPTSSSEAACYIVNHSDTYIIICDVSMQVEKFFIGRDSIPNVKYIVQIFGTINEKHKNTGYVITWDEFMKLGDKLIDDDKVEEQINKQYPGQCSTLIYTSGTTGTPKAVMLSHDNLTWVTKVFCEYLELKPCKDRIISYLPLSHVASQIADIYCATNSAGTIIFARPDAQKGTLSKTIKDTKPTIFFGMPRVWEKIEDALKLGLVKSGTIQQLVSKWARNIGTKGVQANINNESLPFGWSIANYAVFYNIKKILGFEYSRSFFSAAAAINRNTLDFFASLNIPIQEGYGLSESTGPHTLNIKNTHRIGSVGLPINGVMQYIDADKPNDDGEICIRGRHVFMGYLKDPIATKKTIDNRGYLHTGDIGRLDSDGYLYITGRMKDIIITSGGKNVAPGPIEDTIKNELPFISNVLVIGEKKSFLTALLTIKVKYDENMYPTNCVDDIAIRYIKTLGINIQNDKITVKELLDDPNFQKSVENGINAANDKAPTNVHKIRKWSILPTDFSMADGDLTPTMKLKRNVVLKKYSTKVDELYETTTLANSKAKL